MLKLAPIFLALLALVGCTVAEPSTSTAPEGRERASIVSLADGDTVLLSTGDRVRLLQIDTPETHGERECYGQEATATLARLAPAGTEVTLEGDPASDDQDRYGRLLRYIFVAGENVNLEMVRRGAAAPYFYQGEHGRYADQILQAAEEARVEKRGLWGKCNAVLDPEHAVTTFYRGGGSEPPPDIEPEPSTPSGKCHPSYQGVCLPKQGPDLDCGDIKNVPAAGIRVVGDDPYRLDGDGDGVACQP